jgi:hypothetical protein
LQLLTLTFAGFLGVPGLSMLGAPQQQRRLARFHAALAPVKSGGAPQNGGGGSAAVATSVATVADESIVLPGAGERIVVRAAVPADVLSLDNVMACLLRSTFSLRCFAQPSNRTIGVAGMASPPTTTRWNTCSDRSPRVAAYQGFANQYRTFRR